MTAHEIAPALPRAAPERELKFALPEARAGIARRMLDALCRPDPRYTAAIVSTIYYDTPALQLLGEKLNSDFLKTKVRLRWYSAIAGDAGAGHGFLEVKTRVGGLRRKARVQAPLAARWLAQAPLQDPALERVVDLARTLGVELPGRLLPAMLIQYERRRYVEPVSDTRVSLDRRIEVPRCNPVLLRPGGRVKLSTAVIEVKGSGDELPRALLALTHLGARRAAFSKYGEAGLALVRFRL
jgi:hypothetical protein